MQLQYRALHYRAIKSKNLKKRNDAIGIADIIGDIVLTHLYSTSLI